MRWSRKLLLFSVALILAVFLTVILSVRASTHHAALRRTESIRLSTKADELRAWLSHNRRRYNDSIAFLIDMRLASGKNRFFVFDLHGDTVRMAGLVAHGSCNANFSMEPSFSNTSGSGCSSIGKYRIGGPYKGQFGIAYKLHGLDSTNDQAFARNVVLHRYACVPEGETDPIPICNTKGCTAALPEGPSFAKKRKDAFS